MADKILHKRSNTVGSIPTTSSLDLGEIAINTNDGKIFIHKSSSAGESIQSALITDSTNTGSLTLLGSLTLSGSLDINSGSSLDISANYIDFDFDLFALSGSLEVTGSVAVTQGITGSLFGTASYVTGSIFTSTNPVLSASYALSASFAPSTPTTPGGLNTQIQFNSASVFSGSSRLTFDYSTNTFNVIGTASFSGSSPNSVIINGSWTSTANSQRHVLINPTIISRNTTSETISAVDITPILSASANAQVLVGLNISPSYFTAGTSGTNIAKRIGILLEGANLGTINGSNVVFGSLAGRNLSSGFSNVFIGHSTGINVQTGYYNTCVGDGAGSIISTGAALNTHIGYGSGGGNYGTNSNTTVGAESYANIASGGTNVGVGYRSGFSISTGGLNTNNSNCVHVGAYSTAFAGNDSNAIVIGTSAIGQGSNTVVLGNNNIVRTILKGNIGVGFTPISDVAQVSASIHITGSISASLLRIDSPTTNNILFVTGSGRIGIGTGTPTSTLDVSGSINANSLAFSQPPANSFNGEIVKFGAGTLTTGQLYFLSSSGTWSLSDASTTGSSTGMLGIAVGSSPTTDGLLVRGYANSGSFTQSTGSILYMATSSGIFTETAPSSSGHVVRVIGYKTTISNTIYFMPDATWVTLA